MSDQQVRSAMPGDNEQISRLISNASYVHRHLDWRTPLEWIGSQPYLVNEQNGKIRSVLACPPDPPSIGWVRVFASNAEIPVGQAWDNLWVNVLCMAQKKQIGKVAVIVLNKWFEEILHDSGFSCHQEIVMLTRLEKKIPTADPSSGLQVRAMTETDLPRVAELDAMAFDPLWQNTSSALNKAFHQAALATIVEENNVLVGYQISTENLLGGHLARLAVHPDVQGQGIGYSLVIDMIRKLTRIGVTSITVNTQSDNAASLSLYKRVGFRTTGGRYPVYVYEVRN